MFDFGGHGSSGESEGEADSDSSSDSENPEGGVGVDADADVTGLKRKRSRFPGGDADVVKEDNRGASPPPPFSSCISARLCVVFAVGCPVA